MNSENEEKKKVVKVPKELSPQELQRRKKMLVYPLFVLFFIAAMWLIFAPSSDMEPIQVNGFNAELPIPKDEDIIGDKRAAYEQEAIRNKQKDKMRNLQDFAFMLGEEEKQQAGNNALSGINPALSDESVGITKKRYVLAGNTIQSSAYAYKNVNRQLNDWHVQPSGSVEDKTQVKLQERIEELEKQLTEKSVADEQLELIERSYQIASKYMPGNQEGVSANLLPGTDATIDLKEKVIPKPVSQVHHSEVSLLSSPMTNNEFLEAYSRPRNLGFITAAGNESKRGKNSIGAAVYQTVSISDGKELRLRLLEPIKTGNILIPEGTILTGVAKIGAERLHITIASIQYANNLIPVEMEVYDMDGLQGISVPISDEISAAKELAANMGTSMGSSITITDDAGSQLAADLGRSVIQGTSQFFSKKMREVKVTLKSGYRVLLLPKAQ